MEEEYESRRMRRWEELDTDILVKIFHKFSVFELARVCSVWRTACCHPILWKTLDLSHMRSSFIKIPLEPYVYVERRSDESLTRILKLSMNLSGGNTRTLAFHFNLFLSDDQLTYTAERCPGLRRLVLPAWNRIKMTGICKAIRIWKDLESLTMPSIANPPYLFTEIANNCSNFKELKIMGPFEIFFADTLISCLPHLKTLILRCSSINREALIKILDGLKDLEVLNISHSYLVELSGWQPQKKVIVRELDEVILEKASRLKRFLTCMEHETCIMCQRTENDEGIVRWYKYEEDDWKVDEVSSLHL
ncbi:F-box/LRR-repeat protein At3g48880 [Brassica rapa]|uniref:F-box domain-containing protein n=1 Tax=Brassica campestris TaxID=3711 RepID=M4DNE2_BRACM|nr:F-box/LRR-repeat protein At3g48880 [Brassica rapa]XP_009149788.1 F-box/LRR-repeat protein At3g48880 [Brassica rapa]XP_009149789.1 F-box/LRR-repeat protein At3g48880 [Brassica rapa]XP_033130014.1 F-box/LRR-repeat protein At3g48880 [Brassica rapa]XP_033130015.1 F-box/LRR-repeat protein At3g48880 [Brassica rapa]XP_033130016.1 F-box/LRR-repeat protein At3g48880 [Brassica rapa]